MEILYHARAITDKSGRKREILIPSPDLLQTQRSLIPFLETMPIHARACAYVKGGSPQLHASYHQGQQWVLALDLKNFFGTFTASQLHNYLLGQHFDEAVVLDIVRHCTYKGKLPQGAATSPVISNLLFYRLDCQLSDMAQRLGMVYSRYSDDLAFSSRHSLMSSDTRLISLSNAIMAIIKREGFHINQGKTQYNPARLCGVVLTYREPVG